MEADDYQNALRELRAAQAALDHAAAAVAICRMICRRAELAAREKLANALMGKRQTTPFSSNLLLSVNIPL